MTSPELGELAVTLERCCSAGGKQNVALSGGAKRTGHSRAATTLSAVNRPRARKMDSSNRDWPDALRDLRTVIRDNNCDAKKGICNSSIGQRPSAAAGGLRAARRQDERRLPSSFL